jgi:hypothetical protein
MWQMKQSLICHHRDVWQVKWYMQAAYGCDMNPGMVIAMLHASSNGYQVHLSNQIQGMLKP